MSDIRCRCRKACIGNYLNVFEGNLNERRTLGSPDAVVDVGDDGVSVTLDNDKSTWRGKLPIGADGSNSVARKSFCVLTPPIILLSHYDSSAVLSS